MNCTEIDNAFTAYNTFLLNEDDNPVTKLNGKVGSCSRFLQRPSQPHTTNTKNICLIANRHEDPGNERSMNAPYSREEIDKTREAARDAKEDANQHTWDSWKALGNQDWGDCVTESFNGVKSLIESEKLEKEAIRMENENIDHYNNGRK